MRPERSRQPQVDFTPNVFLNRTTNEIPTDGEAIPRIKIRFAWQLYPWDCLAIRGNPIRPAIQKNIGGEIGVRLSRALGFAIAQS